jgi:hypothetical protein
MRAALVLSFAFSSLFAASAFGQYWNNPAGGSWGNAANWTGNAVPTGYAYFNLGSSGYTVTLDQTYTVGYAITIENDNPTIDLDGYTLRSPLLQIGSSTYPNSSLTLVGPGTFTSFGFGEDGTPAGNGQVLGDELILNGASLVQSGLGPTPASSVNTLVLENGGSISVEPEDGFSASNVTINDGSINSGTFSSVGIGQGTVTNGSYISGYSLSAGDLTIDDSDVNDENSMIVFGNNTVQDHGTLGGPSVTLTGTVTILPTGTFGSGQLTMQGGTIIVELYPQIDYPTDVPLSGVAGTVDFTLESGFEPTLGEQFDIFGNTGDKNGFDWSTYDTGTFATINLPPLPAGEQWNTSDLYTTGVISVVPEPVSFGIITLGLAGLSLRRRRYR